MVQPQVLLLFVTSGTNGSVFSTELMTALCKGKCFLPESPGITYDFVNSVADIAILLHAFFYDAKLSPNVSYEVIKSLINSLEGVECFAMTNN